MAIDGISGSIGLTPPAAPAGSSPREAENAFGDALTQLVGAAESSQSNANASISRMIDGTGDVHEAVIALQQADTMLQLTVQIRNKLVQAYQDIMRMPV